MRLTLESITMSTFFLTKQAFLLLAVVAIMVPAAAAALRPPAVPLVTHDPYTSAWSTADHLYDDWPKHWTGRTHAMCGIVRVDGKPMRFMGTATAQKDAVTQKSVEVLPTRSIYKFTAGPVDLDVTFTSPLLGDDLDILSRPVSYVTFNTRSNDGQPHDVKIYFEATAEWTVENLTEKVEWSRMNVPGLKAMRVGKQNQEYLSMAGDNLHINWGHLLVAAPDGPGVSTWMGFADDSRAAFNATGKAPTTTDSEMPRGASELWPALSVVLDLGAVGSQEASRHVLVGYDDIYSIEYFRKPLRAWWRRDPKMTTEKMLAAAAKDYPALMQRCAAFDTNTMAEATKAGGAQYAELCALAYRQTIAAHKLVADTDGKTPLFFSKENFSNGCIATVDVAFPSLPCILWTNPTLVKGQMIPIFEYAKSAEWKFPFAPHDVGTYPRANGQAYGRDGRDLVLEAQMPVEESGNMLMMAAAVSMAENDASFARAHWDTLTLWTDYLVKEGLRPVNQLATTDMLGHLPLNADLALKAIIGIGAYARMCDMLDKPEDARKYLAIAKDYAAQWQKLADDGDHTRLAYDKPGSWSLKHNLIWDRILGLNLFPQSVGDREIAYYLRIQNKYGVPVDSRTDTALIDFNLWSNALARNPADFEALTAPLWRYANETPSRAPLGDWFNTETGEKRGFQARPTVGGIFIRMLKPAPQFALRG
jgi:hypothetical protein